jgi:two-component system cell cycle sensor histidine kinase/response regulator CckA
MPHMNGDETFREIRRLRADVPVVLMSGFSERDTTERFPGRELASFIAKPFDRETLIARIREAVEKRGG